MTYKIDTGVGSVNLHEYTIERGYLNGKMVNLKDLVEFVESKPSVTTDIGQFREVLDTNYWFQPDEEVTTIMFIEHYIRVQKADIKYPIIVIEDDNDVVDGIHRLVKYFTIRKRKIKCVYLTKKEFISLAK